MRKKNFRDFFDANWYQKPINLLSRKGLHPGKTFTDWMDVLLAEKLNSRSRVTLGDIQNHTGNRITVFASQEGKKALPFDSTDDASVSAAYAARCSMSIPFVFIPESEQGIFAFDGGLQNNYPVRAIREAHGDVPFISLFLGDENFKPIADKSILLRLLDIVMKQGEDQYVDEFEDRTVIIDPHPIGTLDFDIGDTEKSYLLACGKVGALRHIVPKLDWNSDVQLSDEMQAHKKLIADVSALREVRKKSQKRRLLLKPITVIFLVGLFFYRSFLFTLVSNLF